MLSSILLVCGPAASSLRSATTQPRSATWRRLRTRWCTSILRIRSRSSAWGGEIAEANNAPGLPDGRPFWIFVNSGVVTEMAQYPDAIDWVTRASAWPGLVPGCCEGGTVAPPSPVGPWPDEGWPADGFYSVVEEVSDDEIEVTMRKWLSCSDYPDRCAPWWTGGEVITDPDSADP